MKKITIIISLLFMLTGCQTANIQDTNLDIAVKNTLETLDPAMVNDSLSREIISNSMEGLVKYDSHDQITPALAKSWTITGEGLIYTFQLNTDRFWTNGDSVTAYDFEYAFQRLASPTTKSPNAVMTEAALISNARDVVEGTKSSSELGIKAISDYELVIKLEEANPYFLSLLANPYFYPVNHTYAKLQNATYGTSVETSLFNGPYKVVQWEEFQPIHLERNEYYPNPNMTSLTGITWHTYLDSNAIGEDIKKGQIDLANSDPILRLILPDYLVHEPSRSIVLLTLNLTDESQNLANQNLRLALMNSIDQNQLASIQEKGALPLTGFIPQSSFFNPTNNHDFRTEYMNILTNKREIAQSAWNQFKLEMNVDDIELSLLSDQAADNVVLDAIKKQLESNLSGLTITVVNVSKVEKFERLRTGDFQLSYTTWTMEYPDPLSIFNDLFLSGNPWNLSHYTNSNYDDMIGKLMPGGDLANSTLERYEMFGAIEKSLLDSAVLIPLFQISDEYVLKDNIKGIEFHPFATADFSNVEIN